LRLVALGYVPLLFLAGGGLLAWWAQSFALALAWLYLLPPLLCRLVLALFGSPETASATPDQPVYLRWWLLTQLQMPFNRLGVLEELLRLIPGVYALWLNLWGASVSPFAFWSRSVLVSERYLVRVGRGAVFGAYSGLAGHLVTRGEDGRMRLTVAPVVVEPGAVVGIRAGLGPGCRLCAGEVLPANRLLPPFTTWRGGRKVRLDAP
jgi:hypothetical protein